MKGSQTAPNALEIHGMEAVGSERASKRFIAMGILMNKHLMTWAQAFDALRVSSQHSHRKLNQYRN
jgi:hypothetical protein